MVTFADDARFPSFVAHHDLQLCLGGIWRENHGRCVHVCSPGGASKGRRHVQVSIRIYYASDCGIFHCPFECSVSQIVLVAHNIINPTLVHVALAHTRLFSIEMMMMMICQRQAMDCKQLWQHLGKLDGTHVRHSALQLFDFTHFPAPQVILGLAHRISSRRHSKAHAKFPEPVHIYHSMMQMTKS